MKGITFWEAIILVNYALWHAGLFKWDDKVVLIPLAFAIVADGILSAVRIKYIIKGD